MRRTPQPDRRIDAQRRRALEDQLKAAIIGLANHMGGEAFYVELSAGDGDPRYLVFGNADAITRFANALTPDGADDETPGHDKGPAGPLH